MCTQASVLWGEAQHYLGEELVPVANDSLDVLTRSYSAVRADLVLYTSKKYNKTWSI